MKQLIFIFLLLSGIMTGCKQEEPVYSITLDKQDYALSGIVFKDSTVRNKRERAVSEQWNGKVMKEERYKIIRIEESIDFYFQERAIKFYFIANEGYQSFNYVVFKVGDRRITKVGVCYTDNDNGEGKEYYYDQWDVDGMEFDIEKLFPDVKYVSKLSKKAELPLEIKLGKCLSGEYSYKKSWGGWSGWVKVPERALKEVEDSITIRMSAKDSIAFEGLNMRDKIITKMGWIEETDKSIIFVINPKLYFRIDLNEKTGMYDKLFWFSSVDSDFKQINEYEITNEIPRFDAYKTFPYTSYKIVEEE